MKNRNLVFSFFLALIATMLIPVIGGSEKYIAILLWAVYLYYAFAPKKKKKEDKKDEKKKD
jgi:predicted PurR-regulated permease PerM